MSSLSRRRSDRVSLTLLLEVSGKDSHGQDFTDSAKSLLVSRSGAVISLERELKSEEQIHIRRKAPQHAHRQSQVRVINQMGRQRDGYLYSIEILDPDMDLWGVDFPAPAEDSD